MKSVKSGQSVPHWKLNFTNADGCLSMCGLCPPCVLATKFLESTEDSWNAADASKRKLLVGLLLRCSNVKVLERTQRGLQIAPWFTYARSRKPTSPEDVTRSRYSGSHVGDLHETDLPAIWDWFSGSPDRVKSNYLSRVFSRCDAELLRLLGNLTSVLLVRQKRGFLQFNAGSNQHTHENNRAGLKSSAECEDSEEDPEDPALMVVPGSSASMSGVSRYKDFICCLPVPLAKKILGLLDERSLRYCQKVCLYWQRLAEVTWKDIIFKRQFWYHFRVMMKQYKSIDVIDATYANIAEVSVPVTVDETGDIHSTLQKAKPFESARIIETTTVQMEERNVYCGAYFTKVLLDRPDCFRVVDYGGGSLLAMGSKDRLLRLLYVVSETRVVGSLKGHIGSIRAVLLCEDRDLAITASYDASIRCWNLKTDMCAMELLGHDGAVNCLDILGDRLVSGAKDCKVKGKPFEEYNFKHPSSVRCVKIKSTTLCSSCDNGLVKVWDMEYGSLLRVIDVHRNSVKCLFFDQWYLISGDSNGQVMAWSTNYDAKACLMTFNHPKEVKSLTLTYLRVVTACVDGKIRIFNFLTGDCLRVITVADEPNRILSAHFHEDRILVNTSSSLTLCQFAKVIWDYREAAQGGPCGAATAQAGSVTEKSPSPLGKIPSASVWADQVASRGRKMPEPCPRPQTRGLFTPSRTRAHGATQRCETAKNSVMLSEKAASERVKKRGPHHHPTCDCILLRVSGIQRSRCRDETSVNTVRNASLRDCWRSLPPQGPPQSDRKDVVSKPRSPRTPKRTLQTPKCALRPQTCVPVLRRTASENIRNALHVRVVSTAPDTATQPFRCSFCQRVLPHTADTQKTIRRTGVGEGPRAPASILRRPTHVCCLKWCTMQRASGVQAERGRQGTEGTRAEQ